MYGFRSVLINSLYDWLLYAGCILHVSGVVYDTGIVGKLYYAGLGWTVVRINLCA